MKKNKYIILLLSVLMLNFLFYGCSYHNALNIDESLKKDKNTSYDAALTKTEKRNDQIKAEEAIIDYTKIDKGKSVKGNKEPFEKMFTDKYKGAYIYNYNWTVQSMNARDDYFSPCLVIMDAKLKNPTSFKDTKSEIRKIFDDILSEYKGFIYEENIYTYSEEDLKKNPIALITKVDSEFYHYYITFETGYDKTFSKYYVRILTFNTDGIFRPDINPGLQEYMDDFSRRMNGTNEKIKLKTIESGPNGYIVNEKNPDDSSHESPEDNVIKNRIIYN